MPNCEETISKRQADQKMAHDKHCKPHELGLSYVPAVMRKKLGPLMYLIHTQDGLTWKRHIEHLKGLGHDATVTPVVDTTDEGIIYPTWLDTNSSSVPDSVDQAQNPVSEQPLDIILSMNPDIHLVGIFKKVTMTNVLLG